MSSFDGHPFRIEWLPDPSTQRTNCGKTVSEIIHCYFRYFKKKKRLFAGEKPSGFAKNKTITKREWQSALNKSNRKNPIKEGQRYLDCLEVNPAFKYQDIANEFGVSKTRVHQMIALIKKLPRVILDYFFMEDNSENLRNFTERKLRPVTLLDSDEEKIDFFRAMT